MSKPSVNVQAPVAILAVTALALASCTGGPPRGMRGGPGGPPGGPGGMGGAAIFEEASLGHCTDTVVARLRCMANEGRGDVKAQGLLGACLTKENATRAEALVWLERAANGGDPDAQARLAAYYAHAAMPDWTAARMWVLVHGRAAVRAVPADPVDPHLVGEIAAHLSPGDETEAQTRAQSWQLSVWTPNPDAADEKACPRREGPMGGGPMGGGPMGPPPGGGR